MMPIDVLCVGHAAYDISLFVDQYPQENSKCEAEVLLEDCGGPASNAAYLLSKWNVASAFAGLVGDDLYGKRIVDAFRLVGTDVSMLQLRPGHVTPLSVILVPLYSIVAGVGLINTLWGVILPTVATPTGVFLLRQYMLTIPDELLEAARMDHASEWQIYWRIVLPLTAPALAVRAIFSVVWRWNDFLWPLIVLSRQEVYTLQVGLNAYAGELNVQWHYLLAMTVITMIPVVLVFVFLQRFITAGIAGSGLK